MLCLFVWWYMLTIIFDKIMSIKMLKCKGTTSYSITNIPNEILNTYHFYKGSGNISDIELQIITNAICNSLDIKSPKIVLSNKPPQNIKHNYYHLGNCDYDNDIITIYKIDNAKNGESSIKNIINIFIYYLCHYLDYILLNIKDDHSRYFRERVKSLKEIL